jgi:hypothetical protein
VTARPEHLLDVEKLVKTYAVVNDNAEVGFDADALKNFAAQKTIDVPCGRFYLTAMTGNAAVTLKVSGRAALFVGGDINLAGGLAIELTTATAELDLFVEGGLSVSGSLNFGDGKTPSRIRLYAGGQNDIQLSGSARFDGNLYAPKARLVTSGNTEVFGSLFARSVSASGSMTVHYDRAILRAGQDCPKAPPPGAGQPDCKTCRDCNNQACIGGKCGQCRTDADCCAPLTCSKGTCVPRIL